MTLRLGISASAPLSTDGVLWDRSSSPHKSQLFFPFFPILSIQSHPPRNALHTRHTTAPSDIANMRFSTMLLAAFTASTALASPLLQVRQNNDEEDNTLFSPLNNTQITPGGTLNFTYRVDDDDARAVRVALVQIIEVSRSGGFFCNGVC